MTMSSFFRWSFCLLLIFGNEACVSLPNVLIVTSAALYAICLYICMTTTENRFLYLRLLLGLADGMWKQTNRNWRQRKKNEQEHDSFFLDTHFPQILIHLFCSLADCGSFSTDWWYHYHVYIRWPVASCCQHQHSTYIEEKTSISSNYTFNYRTNALWHFRAAPDWINLFLSFFVVFRLHGVFRRIAAVESFIDCCRQPSRHIDHSLCAFFSSLHRWYVFFHDSAPNYLLHSIFTHVRCFFFFSFWAGEVSVTK